MSVGTTGPADTVTPDSTAGRRGFPRWLPPLLMLAVVGVGAALPLIRNHIFYLWDDTAAAGLPNWLQMAESVTKGRIPLLELEMWRGGNFAAEGVGGMWNPVVVAVAIGTYYIDNMAIAITLAKTFFMMVMAGGSYLLARGYGVRPTLAATLGAALPLAGYSLFVDGTAWVNALILTAFTPWLWWTARRVLHQGGSLVWVVVAGYLCCSLGNPYGLLSTGFVFLGVMVEAWVSGKRPKIVGLVLSGVAVLMMSVLVYLPLLLTSHVGYRAGSRTYNDEFLAPTLTDFMGMSTPTFQPYIVNFNVPYLTVPVMYLAWFVLPLLPWLRWRVLRDRWRSLSAIYLFGAIYLLLMLGPSQVWMFRWPLRLIDFMWFAVGLLFVIMASAGLDRTHWKRRAFGSVGIIGFGAYLAWSDVPMHAHRHALGALVVIVLVAALVRFDVISRLGYAVFAVGTLIVLALQVTWFPGWYNVNNYQFPNSRALIEERFAKYDGLTVQIADLYKVPPGSLLPDKAYQDMLWGNLYSVAGVESTTAYSGIGYTLLDEKLCAQYEGSTTCPDAWNRMFRTVPGYDGATFADLINARTVVVQNALINTANWTAPPGWHRSVEDEDSGLTTVWKRTDPPRFPDGRLSHVPDGVTIDSDAKTDRIDEKVRFTRDSADGEAKLTFARLNWPGYTATVNGTDVPVGTGFAGLVEVPLPKGVTSGEIELKWTPPGFTAGVAGYVAGGTLTLGLAVVPWLLRRRRGHTPDAPTELDNTSAADLADLDRAPQPIGTMNSAEGGVRP
ncbi:hypothetical protein [Alloactinosynnema sp. L-07]|uniref:hypothetical protein n=1 Tax=Alloactinosynnema sp. L-07 TaxID=1653480 RepID=UPI001560C0ED|nr:hypothetical protein [Alloactinosynnema sp. L-07]